MDDITIDDAREIANRLVRKAMEIVYPDATGRLLLIETTVYATGQAVRLAGAEDFGPTHPFTIAYREIADRAGIDAFAHTQNLLLATNPPSTAPKSTAMREAAEEMGAKFIDASLVGDAYAEKVARIPARPGALYDRDVPGFADLMTVAEFREHVACGGISDHDGSANAVRNGRMCDEDMDIDMIPSDATHVAWFNK